MQVLFTKLFEEQVVQLLFAGPKQDKQEESQAPQVLSDLMY